MNTNYPNTRSQLPKLQQFLQAMRQSQSVYLTHSTYPLLSTRLLDSFPLTPTQLLTPTSAIIDKLILDDPMEVVISPVLSLSIIPVQVMRAQSHVQAIVKTESMLPSTLPRSHLPRSLVWSSVQPLVKIESILPPVLMAQTPVRLPVQSKAQSTSSTVTSSQSTKRSTGIKKPRISRTANTQRNIDNNNEMKLTEIMRRKARANKILKKFSTQFTRDYEKCVMQHADITTEYQSIFGSYPITPDMVKMDQRSVVVLEKQNVLLADYNKALLEHYQRVNYINQDLDVLNQERFKKFA